MKLGGFSRRHPRLVALPEPPQSFYEKVTPRQVHASSWFTYHHRFEILLRYLSNLPYPPTLLFALKGA